MSTEPDKIETVTEIQVPSGYRENERLDVYLTRFIPNVSRSKVQQGIRDGRVTVNGKEILRPSHLVQAHDEIVCRILKSPPIRAEPEAIPLDVVFEDEHLLVVNKAAGMVVHPAYGNRTGTLVNALLHHVGGGIVSFEDEEEEALSDDEVGLSMMSAAPVSEIDVSIRPGIVHRLDKDTSGLLVVAKSDHVHSELARQFIDRTIDRRYKALVRAEPEAIPLDVVFEDEHLLVVNKAAGMVVHPAYGNRTGTLVNALLHHVGGGIVSFEDEEEEALSDDEVGLSMMSAAPVSEIDVSIRPGIVHRLDKDTSGLLVVAKSDHVHSELARQFIDRTIDRRYKALVRGEPDPPAGTIDTNLARDPRDRKRMAVSDSLRGKRAITHYRSIEPFGIASLVQFKLETGRTHQIRVHAAYIGHPVLADETYGGDQLLGSNTARTSLKTVLRNLPNQALHAATLGFVHPVTQEKMYFEAPLPTPMANVLERLRQEKST